MDSSGFRRLLGLVKFTFDSFDRLTSVKSLAMLSLLKCAKGMIKTSVCSPMSTVLKLCVCDVWQCTAFRSIKTAIRLTFKRLFVSRQLTNYDILECTAHFQL